MRLKISFIKLFEGSLPYTEKFDGTNIYFSVDPATKVSSVLSQQVRTFRVKAFLLPRIHNKICGNYLLKRFFPILIEKYFIARRKHSRERLRLYV